VGVKEEETRAVNVRDGRNSAAPAVVLELDDGESDSRAGGVNTADRHFPAACRRVLALKESRSLDNTL
jgi:hypothetical protein